MNSKVQIRRCKGDDIKILLDMTSKEGWSTSHVDSRAGLEVDGDGLLVAEDKGGAPLGFIGLFNMSPGMTFVGDFIVKEDHRGSGIGKKLWSAMINATKGRVLVLDSAFDMEHWYREHGFHHEAYCSTFCSGTVVSEELMEDHCAYDIMPISDELWPALVAYDMHIYPYPRENSLKAWFLDTDAYSVVALHNKKVVGYANFHWKSKNECNIRALYGDDKAVANSLFVNLLQKIPVGTKVGFNLLIDKPLPECFSGFQRFKPVHRLYTKEIPAVQTDKIFFNTTHMV